MTREDKENLLLEAVNMLIRSDIHLMTSTDKSEFKRWVEELIEFAKGFDI